MRFLCVFLVLMVGCNLTEPLDVNNPNKPEPATPTLKPAPADSYYRGLARRIESKKLKTPRDMAAIVLQLIQSGDMDEETAGVLDAKFPKMAEDDRLMGKDDIETLRSLK